MLAAVRAAAENPASKRVALVVDTPNLAALRFTIAPIRHAEAHFALMTIEDVTQQRVAAAAMNSFLARAAHELRTPLTNIRLFVEEALEHCERNPMATSRCLNVINDETQRLDRTVAEILSVSQIEAGSFELKRDDIHVDELLQKLKVDHEAQAREKRIAYEFDLPPKLPVFQGDRDKVALALHNLVGNALKYTLDGGRIVVSAQVEKGRLSVAVSDTGTGDQPGRDREGFREVLPVQEPAGRQRQRVGPGPADRPRSGAAAWRRHLAESELGKGSTFTLVLPLTEEKA